MKILRQIVNTQVKLGQHSMWEEMYLILGKLKIMASEVRLKIFEI